MQERFTRSEDPLQNSRGCSEVCSWSCLSAGPPCSSPAVSSPAHSAPKGSCSNRGEKSSQVGSEGPHVCPPKSREHSLLPLWVHGCQRQGSFRTLALQGDGWRQGLSMVIASPKQLVDGEPKPRAEQPACWIPRAACCSSAFPGLCWSWPTLTWCLICSEELSQPSSLGGEG